MDELRFRIDAFRPDTIPMARLAAYMVELAALLGNEKSIHFVRLDPGSVELVHRVDREDQPKVKARLTALRQGDGPADAVRAYRRLDDLLAADNAVGALAADHQAIIIRFPGRTRPEPIDYGLVTQPGTLDGIPVKLGGLDDTVPVHLQEIGPTGLVHICQATRPTARRIAACLFETPIRVHGTGRWRREASGTWKLVRFVVSDFVVLDDAPLATVVGQMRNVEGNRWRQTEHPLATLRPLRDGDENTP